MYLPRYCDFFVEENKCLSEIAPREEFFSIKEGEERKGEKNEV